MQKAMATVVYAAGAVGAVCAAVVLVGGTYVFVRLVFGVF